MELQENHNKQWTKDEEARLVKRMAELRKDQAYMPLKYIFDALSEEFQRTSFALYDHYKNYIIGAENWVPMRRVVKRGGREMVTETPRENVLESVGNMVEALERLKCAETNSFIKGFTYIINKASGASHIQELEKLRKGNHELNELLEKEYSMQRYNEELILKLRNKLSRIEKLVNGFSALNAFEKMKNLEGHLREQKSILSEQIKIGEVQRNG